MLFMIRRFSSRAKRSTRGLHKSPKMVSLSGNVQQSVVRLTPSEQSLCFLHDTEEQGKRLLCLLLARRFVERASKSSGGYATCHGFEPRFQLFHVTTGSMTDCELEPNLVTGKSVEHGTKTQFLVDRFMYFIHFRFAERFFFCIFRARNISGHSPNECNLRVGCFGLGSHTRSAHREVRYYQLCL